MSVGRGYCSDPGRIHETGPSALSQLTRPQALHNARENEAAAEAPEGESSGRIFAWLRNKGEDIQNRASDAKDAIADFGKNHKVGLKRAGMALVGLAVAAVAAAAIYALVQHFGVDASTLQNLSNKAITTVIGWGSTAGSFIKAHWELLAGAAGLLALGAGLGAGATELAHRSRAIKEVAPSQAPLTESDDTDTSEVDPSQVPLPESDDTDGYDSELPVNSGDEASRTQSETASLSDARLESSDDDRDSPVAATPLDSGNDAAAEPAMQASPEAPRSAALSEDEAQPATEPATQAETARPTSKFKIWLSGAEADVKKFFQRNE